MGQIAGAGEFRFADKIPAIKVPCRHAVLFGLCACRPVVSRNFAEVFARQIGMLGSDRSIDEPDRHFGAPAGAFHQRCELNQFQRRHVCFPNLAKQSHREHMRRKENVLFYFILFLAFEKLGRWIV